MAEARARRRDVRHAGHAPVHIHAEGVHTVSFERPRAHGQSAKVRLAMSDELAYIILSYFDFYNYIT